MLKFVCLIKMRVTPNNGDIVLLAVRVDKERNGIIPNYIKNP